MERYDHKSLEAKWQSHWEKEQTFKVSDKAPGERAYVLDMFPYPSAQGLHVGHPEGYTATDIYCRYLRMKGVNILHPMGWDAFGLPTENYAIKTGAHPRELTWQNIDNFRRQIKSFGFSYDWSREVNTADPTYYKWTQWLFLQLYKKGLAYRKEAPVNWCPSCQTVLANEQVVNGECERCHSQVEQRQMAQWFFKITDYAEALLKSLDGLDWPQSILDMQRNWIGKSEGAEVEFGIHDSEFKIRIFTTRLDTIFGATYMVLAPEHKLVQELKDKITNWREVQDYIQKTQKKTELERKAEEKSKTGVRLEGVEVINPANQEKIPVFIADYVLTSYGTGAIMAVPAHDERDWEFADRYGLKMVRVIEPRIDENFKWSIRHSGVSAAMAEGEDYKEVEKRIMHQHLDNIHSGSGCWIGEGKLMNSREFNGVSSEDARHEIAKKIGAKLTTQYRLRDWLISRQRYWGAPIPIIYCDPPAGGCGAVPVPAKDLPVELPMDVDFRPRGESPLVRSESFHKVSCPKCGAPARRESDTMDTFVDSSWYFLRYVDPQNNKKAFDAKPVKQWLPVNLYVGGAEHAVMHLLYARFITKALKDLGYIEFTEPFLKLRNQGLILGEDGQKMSKSRGNVVNPDEIVDKFGADTLRLYEMFLGPLEDSKPWNTSSIIGVRRFLERVWNFCQTDKKSNSKVDEALAIIARTIKKVTEDIEAFRFNTSIAALMEFINKLDDVSGNENVRRTLLILLYPFAPHITAELWQRCGFKGYVWEQDWPTYNKSALKSDTITITVQVNGKLRSSIQVAADAKESDVAQLAQADENVARHLVGKTIIRQVYVPGRLVNFVVE